MAINHRQEFIERVAKILEVHPLKVDLGKTLVPPDKIDEVVKLLSGRVFIFKISAKLDRKRLPKKGSPTIRELYHAIERKKEIVGL